MRSIGFKNFRRFEELKPIELSGVTFFVGGNNAGKSTVVKAMMLVLNNIIHILGQTNHSATEFSLTAENGRDAHVGTFGRALHKPYPATNEIQFESEIENFSIRYTIGGDVESLRLNADVHEIVICDNEDRFQVCIDYVNGQAQFRCPQRSFDQIAYLEAIKEKRDKMQDYSSWLEKILDEVHAIEDSLASLDEIHQAAAKAEIKRKLEQFDRINKQASALRTQEESDYKEDIRFSVEDGLENANVFTLICNAYNTKADEAKALLKRAKGASTQVKCERTIKICEKAQSVLRKMEEHLSETLGKANMVIIPSHAVAQRAFFSMSYDKDYMSNVIGAYQYENYPDGSKQKQFVQKWMNKFGIGLDFMIDSIQGEAFTVTVTNMKGEFVQLADLGMGSIQIILLLLRLATLLDAFKRSSTLVLIEEPEQNIHPKLQSVLAELFESVHREYNVRFLIETHSEYLIRKTQAMIATGAVDFNNNPFRVYYFPEEGEPYDMVYQESGMFTNKFDEGFFDEASKQQFSVIKKAREIKNV